MCLERRRLLVKPLSGALISVPKEWRDEADVLRVLDGHRGGGRVASMSTESKEIRSALGYDRIARRVTVLVMAFYAADCIGVTYLQLAHLLYQAAARLRDQHVHHPSDNIQFFRQNTLAVTSPVQRIVPHRLNQQGRKRDHAEAVERHLAG